MFPEDEDPQFQFMFLQAKVAAMRQPIDEEQVSAQPEKTQQQQKEGERRGKKKKKGKIQFHCRFPSIDAVCSCSSFPC